VGQATKEMEVMVMAGTNMETLLNKNSKQEATEVIEFLKELDQNEKNEFFSFMQGIRFAKNLKPKKLKMA
jgi:hypothetical protein